METLSRVSEDLLLPEEVRVFYSILLTGISRRMITKLKIGLTSKIRKTLHKMKSMKKSDKNWPLINNR